MAKALWALVGGLGGGVSLALLALLTKLFNPQGNYVLAVVFSAMAFIVMGIAVGGSVVLALAMPHHHMLRWLLIGILVGGCVAGIIFPWGTFGYHLSFLTLGLILALTLNRASLLAWRNVLWVLAGILAGEIAATLWVIAIGLWQSALLHSVLMSSWIPFGLISYGLTLGLLLSLRNP